MAKRRPDLRPLLFSVTLALLLALAPFAVGACGGDDGAATTTASAAPGAAGEGRVIDQATAAGMKGSEFQRLARESSDRLMARLGGDEGGFYATLLALDRGYDVYQLLTGSLNDRLLADGLVTAADGSALSPARAPGGVFQLATSDEPILVAALSGPLLIAEGSTSPGDAVVRVGGMAITAKELFEAVVARRTQPVESGDDVLEAGTEEWLHGHVTHQATLLAARGYSAAQIVQGLVLDAVRFKEPDILPDDVDPQDPESAHDYYCAYIQHTSGVMLKPEHPPVDVIQEMLCDTAAADAPRHFVDTEVREALEGDGQGQAAAAGGGAAAPGGASSGAAGGQTTPAGGDGDPPAIDLSGRWVGTETPKRVAVEGQELTGDSFEGCDFSTVYRTPVPLKALLQLKSDGTGTLEWAEGSVGLETGHVETMSKGNATLTWTWADGVYEFDVEPEWQVGTASAGTFTITGVPRTLEDGTVVFEGTWHATAAGDLFGDGEVLGIDAEGIVHVEKQVE